jgi:hypothetical protein
VIGFNCSHCVSSEISVVWSQTSNILFGDWSSSTCSIFNRLAVRRPSGLIKIDVIVIRQLILHFENCVKIPTVSTQLQVFFEIVEKSKIYAILQFFNFFCVIVCCSSYYVLNNYSDLMQQHRWSRIWSHKVANSITIIALCHQEKNPNRSGLPHEKATRRREMKTIRWAVFKYRMLIVRILAKFEFKVVFEKKEYIERRRRCWSSSNRF